MPHRTSPAQRMALAAVLLGAALSGCSDAGAAKTPSAAQDAPTAAQAVVSSDVTVAALRTRLRPDVLVVGKLSAKRLSSVRHLARGTVTYSAGTAKIGGTKVRVAAVDPSSFRSYAAKGTAEATSVWQAVASGQAVASHAVASKLKLQLGSPVTVRANRPLTLRLGALATTGVPGTDVVLDQATADKLGVNSSHAVLLSAGKGDPVKLAGKARKAVGDDAEVTLLSAPAQNPFAFLTGSRAARMFGGFSYTYFPDGTIVPEARWVRANIVSARVPLIGLVTCHRLMVPQLRGALQEVKDRGLGHTIDTYNGCYVPRFIERDPSHAISLHTWGIAIDFNAATNYRGIKGTMHPEVVQIFKRWGFRWGGDWKYTDPMHFEMGAVLRT